MRYQSPGGSRETLTASELALLENKILPEARRWVSDYPGLREHGEQTLRFWGERLNEPNDRSNRK